MNTIYNTLRFISNLPGLKQFKRAIGSSKTKRRNKQFLKKGVKVIKNVDNVLTNAGVNYSVVFGTMLGAIREKGFIKHDLDIDIAVWYDEVGDSLKELLTNNGFSFYRSISVDNGCWGREETYYCDGVSIDIFYFYENIEEGILPYTPVFVLFPGYDNKINCLAEKHGMMPIQLFLPLSRETKYVSFETTQVPVPINAEEFLEARYGKNWRIPDPTFVYPKMGDVSCSYREDKLGVIETN